MKSKTIKYILVLFNIVMLSSLGRSQCEGCNPDINSYYNQDSLSYVDCTEWVININDCNQGDLGVLQKFIDNSQEGYLPPPSDLLPIELRDQYWGNGRLIHIDNWRWWSINNLRRGSSDYYFLSGEIPSEIGNLTNIELIDLSGFFTKQIPTEIGNLTNLTWLFLHSDSLTGEIPSEIGNLTNLVYSRFTGQFTGVIPSEFVTLTKLIYLDLNNNQLTGGIPPEIGQLTNLTTLFLYGNQLTGEIPSEIGQLTNLTDLGLDDNQLTGEIPIEIVNLTNLTDLRLNINQLTGEIPIEIGNLTNLNILSLSNNQLTGEIPSEIGNLTNLTTLFLYGNQLTGEIPIEIGNLTNLNILSLRGNQLTGEIPIEIGNLTNLILLYLNENQFSGTISESFCNLPLNWGGVNEYDDFSFKIQDNNICPPYPSCIEEYVGEQDTSECTPCQLSELGYIEKDGFCYYQSDLDILNFFIGNNPNLNPDLDIDSSGVIETLEFGIQEWMNNRLTSLDLSNVGLSGAGIRLHC